MTLSFSHLICLHPRRVIECTHGVTICNDDKSIFIFNEHIKKREESHGALFLEVDRETYNRYLTWSRN